MSGLSPAERAIAGSGAALFLNGFIPWWYRIHTPRRTYLHNAGLSGWSLVAVLAGFVAALMVALRRRPGRARRDDALYGALGIAAVGALVVQSSRTSTEWVGFWVALAVSVLLLVAAVRRRNERRGGWV